MRFEVQLTLDAQRDLDDLHAFVSSADGATRADRLVDSIAAALGRLTTLPNRGEIPRELEALGIRAFRQVHHKPYRMIYQVQAGTVTVLLIADARRDMQQLLQRRLLA